MHNAYAKADIFLRWNCFFLFFFEMKMELLTLNTVNEYIVGIFFNILMC